MKPASKFVFINAMKDQEHEDWGGAESRFRDRRGRWHYDNGRFSGAFGSFPRKILQKELVDLLNLLTN